MGGFEFVGFYEKDVSVSEELARRLPKLKRFTVPSALLDAGPDVVMIHSLDPDVPRWARFALDHPKCFKGLFLENPGAASPADFVGLAKEIRAKRPVLAVELGYELHYPQAMAFARKVVREEVLGGITTARFHGGCPSGAGMDLWQSIPDDLGGIVQTEGCHTLENILDLFGTPERLVSTIRKLPERPPHRVVGWIPDLFSGTVEDDESAVGSLMHKDVTSAMLEYPDKIVMLDLTAWEPTEWCSEWAIDIYGINGSLHAVPDPPSAKLYLREKRGGLPAGHSQMETHMASEDSNIAGCFKRQFGSLFNRVRGYSPHGCCGLENASDILRVMDAAYRSARERKWIDIE
jgi:predicted dehydrogenase